MRSGIDVFVSLLLISFVLTGIPAVKGQATPRPVAKCGTLTCTNDAAHTGYCDTKHPTRCGCRPGHYQVQYPTDPQHPMNSCAVGSKCSGNLTVCDTQAKFERKGLCLANNPRFCRCAEDYQNDSNGDCVPRRATCGTGAAEVLCISDADHTGQCDSGARANVCECRDGRVYEASAKKCVEAATCTSPKLCEGVAGTDGSNLCNADKVTCRCAAGYENEPVDEGSKRGKCVPRCGNVLCMDDPSTREGCNTKNNGCACKRGSMNDDKGNCSEICSVIGEANYGSYCTDNVRADVCKQGVGCRCKVGFAPDQFGKCLVDICDHIRYEGAEGGSSVAEYCDSNSIAKTCVPGVGCKCKPGYITVAEDGKCTGDVCDSKPKCADNTTDSECESFKGCKCKPGYDNDSTGECVDVCDVIKERVKDDKSIATINEYCKDNSTTNLCIPKKGCACDNKHTPARDGRCTVLLASTCGLTTCNAQLGQTGQCTTDNKCECAAGYTNHVTGANIGICADVCEVLTPADCDANLEANVDSVCTPLKGCKCSEDFTNGPDGKCVRKSAVCGGSKCLSGATQTGTCDGHRCQCKPGHTTANRGSTQGTCVEGGECAWTSTTTNCTTLVLPETDEAGVCTANNPNWCKCATGFTNDPTTGKCVRSAKCGGNTCTAGAANTGECTDHNTCKCREGYANKTDGTCVDLCEVLDAGTMCVEPFASDDKCTPHKGCTCAADYENEPDGSCAIKVAECGGKECSAGNVYTGKCDSTTDTYCGCKTGYTNVTVGEAEGMCVKGSKCDGVTCGDGGDAGTGACLVDNNKKCICTHDYAHGTDDKCVAGGICADGFTCTGDMHTGTCAVMDDNKCMCSDNGTHAVGKDGKCTAGGVCKDVGVCISEDDTGVCDAATKSICVCKEPTTHAPGNMKSCVEGVTCNVDCTAKNNTGTCEVGGNVCKCEEGYAMGKEGVCVEGYVCSSSNSCGAAGETGTCTAQGGSVCNCATGFANVAGTCTLGVECSGMECNLAGEGGKCTPDQDGNTTAVCVCNEGYENISTGHCAQKCGDCDGKGSCSNVSGQPVCTCNDGYMNAEGDKTQCVLDCSSCGTGAGYLKEDRCTKTGTEPVKCSCADGYINSDNVTCKPNCKTCTGDGYEDNKCTMSEDGNLTCTCSAHHMNDVDPSICVKNCSPCDRSAPEYNGGCDVAADVLTCACEHGYVHDTADSTKCVNACGTSCDAAKDGYTGTCLTAIDGPSCECSANYLNDDLNPLLCKLSCAECGANTNGQCTNPEGVLTCGCKDGFKVTPSNPKICENACGTNCPNENDVYVGTCTTAGGSASCVCKTGHKHDPSNPFTCVSGSPCEGVTCKIGTGYKGACEEDRGFAHCPCADKYTNTEDLTICTLNCSACTDTNAVAGCTLVGDTLTCNCKTGYVNGADPLTCTVIPTTSSTTTSTVSVTLPALPALTTTSAAAAQSFTFISLTVAMFATAMIFNRF